MADTSRRTTKPTSTDEVTPNGADGNTTRRPAATTRCECGDEIVEINLLIDGEEITMCSCSNCDRRSWHRAGEPIELDGILHDLSNAPTRYRRDLANR